jgi:hypothetical protein
VASAGASLPVATGRSRQLGAPKLLVRSPPRLPGARRFRAWLHAPPESPPPREPEPFSPSLGPKALLRRLGHPVPVGVRSPGWDDPPLVDLRALAFARPTHRPSCPKARRAMPMFGSGRRLPGSAAFGAIAGRPETVPLRAGLVGEPTSVPEAGPCSGCPDQRPGAVHADPVARALAWWRLRTEWFLGSSWGAPVASARCLAARGHRPKPTTRCTEAAPPLAAPVARCSSLQSVASRPAGVASAS